MSARVDRFVRDNRITIAVVVPVIGALVLVASAESMLPNPLAFNAILLLLGTLAMRLPILATFVPLRDRRLVVGLVGLTAFTYAIEYVGVTTGWPYGSFVYGVDLGPMIGGVPLGLPLFYLPLVANSYILAVLVLPRSLRGGIARVGTGLLFLLIVDLILDPGAVALGFWGYGTGGPYYGVPLSNFAGWVLTGTIALAILDRSVSQHRLRNRLATCEFATDDLVSFVFLWGAVGLLYGLWVPVVLTVGLAVMLSQVARISLPWRPPTGDHQHPSGSTEEFP